MFVINKGKLYIFYTILYLILLVTFFIVKILKINLADITWLLIVYPGILAFFLSREKIKIYKINIKKTISNLFIITFIMLLIYFFSGIISSIFSNSPIMLPEIKKLGIQIILGLSIAAISSFPEEYAWRSFVQNQKERNLYNYILIGFFWSIFHIPIIIETKLYQDVYIGIIIHSFMLISFSVLLSFIKEKYNNLIILSFMHGLFNSLFLTNSVRLNTNANVLIESFSWSIVFVFTIFIFLKLNKKFV